MSVDLGGALVGWVVSLAGNAGIQLVRRPYERTLSKAMRLAVEKVVDQTGPSSQDALRHGLRECFSAPPRLALDASVSVYEGLRAAIAAQVAQLDHLVRNDTGQPFYQAVPVDRAWLGDQIVDAVLMALRQVVAASGVTELVHGMDAAETRGAIDQAHSAQGTTPASVGVRVRDAQPGLLGVHPAIRVAGAKGYLPEYVPRDIDNAARGVRTLISSAAQDGGFVVLVGGSSVGKTRCAYQAVNEILPEWQLLHPAPRAKQLEHLAVQPVLPTVVWLDDLDRYLGGSDGLTANTVRALLNGYEPIVLVATLWPGRYNSYTTPPKDGHHDDLHRWEREVLALAEVVHLDQDWSHAELGRAKRAAATDPRIAHAMSTGGRFSLPQILAAAPHLADRWDHADPYAAAVLAAAVDATRLGYRSPLPVELLRAAAVGYCDSRAQATAPVDWFDTAISYATEPLHGAASALEPVAAHMGETCGYLVADYLLHYATPRRHRQPIPRHTWDALLAHTHDPADAARIGHTATNRLLHPYATQLLRRAAHSGDPEAARRLANLLTEQGDTDAAIELLRAHADVGEPFAVLQLADLLAKRGDLDASTSLLRGHADVGDEWAVLQLADLLAKQDDWNATNSVLRERAEAGDSWAAYLLARQGDPDGAATLLRARAEAGDSWAAYLLAKQGDVDVAVSLLRERADAGDAWAAKRLAALLARQGDIDALRDRADHGDSFAARKLAAVLAKRGDLDAAIALLRDRADGGDFAASHQLAALLAKRGDTEAAVMLLRERADVGDSWAAHELAGLLARRGDLDALQARADAGDSWAAHELARLLADRGDLEALRARADAGHSWAALRLAELLAVQGDTDAAVALLRERADAGDSWAAFRLADLLAKQADAEALLLTEVQVGNSQHAAAAWFRLLEQSENPADRIRARRVRRSGLTPPPS